MKKVFVQAITCGAFASVLMLADNGVMPTTARVEMSAADIISPLVFRGDVSPANTTYTINRPGVYRLTSAKTASGVPNISITANNVTLDLGDNMLAGGTNGVEMTGNAITVKNGTITGMTQSGIVAQGMGCQIHNCDLISCTTGITLSNASECVVDNCRVRNMTQAGVSLQSTWTSRVTACEISGIHGSEKVYGVYAANGGNNSIEQCVICDLQTSSSTIGAEVGGIVFDNDRTSQIKNSQISTIASLTTTAGAYGVLVRMPVGATAAMPSQPATNGSVPQVVVDRNSNALAVWVQNDGSRNQIYYARYTVGGTWSNAAKIPGQLLRASSQPQLAIDPAGNCIAVWYVFTGTTVNIYSSRYTPDGTWSVPVNISGSSPIFNNPQIAVDSSGNALAVWENGSSGIQYGWYTVGGAWGSPSTFPAQGTFPQVAFDSDNNALVVWVQSDGLYDQIYYVRYDTVQSLWSMPAVIPGQVGASNSAAQHVVCDSVGNALALWTKNDRVYWSRYTADGAVWSTAAELPGQTATGTEPHCAVTPQGDAVAVWIQNALVYYSIYNANNSTWSTAVALPGQSITASDPHVALDSDGNRLAVWVSNSQIWYARYTVGLGWTQAALEPDQPVTAGQQPQVTMNTKGTAIAVWSQSNGAVNQIYSSLSLAATGWISGTSVTGVTSIGAGGVGVYTPNCYIAKNTAYECDLSFAGVSSDYLTSQANARGVYNIDASLTTLDKVEALYDTSLPIIESQVDVLTTLSSIESIVDVLSGCVAISVTAPSTLSTAGSYCLADTINGTLSITGTDITVCMNEHTINGGQLLISGDHVTVSQGTVRNNASASGVVLTGNNCFLNTIRSINNRTGFELNSADQNTLTRCTAMGCTQEGFLLNNSERNYLAQCEVQSLVGTGTVAGFKTSNGTSNKFMQCSVNGVSTTDGDAYGMRGDTEHKSLFLGNSINDVSASAGSAKGLELKQDSWLNNAVSFEWTFSVSPYISFPISWLKLSPNLAYLAVGNASASDGYDILVFRFDGAETLNLAYILSGASYVIDTLQWLKVDNAIYLAVGGNSNSSGIDFKIYTFDTVSETLLALPNATYVYDNAAGEYPYSCSWLSLGDRRLFLAIGGSGVGSGNNVRILSFDGNYLSLVTEARTGDVLATVDWCITGSRYLLAVASSQADPAVSVYEFDPTNNTLSSKDTYNAGSGTCSAVRWLNYQEELYLAATFASTTSNVRVLSYDSSTDTLSSVTGLAETSSAGASADWLVTGSTVYLAFGLSDSAREANVYQFDPTIPSLTSFYMSSFTDAINGYYVRWFTGVQGRALFAIGFSASGGGATRAVSVIGFDVVGSTTSLVLDTTVSNVAGTGIAVNELSDSIFNSKVSNATTPYYPWQPLQFDPSNIIVPS